MAGIYHALQADIYIKANLSEIVVDRGPLANKLLQYKIYDEINAITNNLKKIRIDTQSKLGDNQQLLMSHDLLSTITDNDQLLVNLRDIFDKNKKFNLLLNKDNSFYHDIEHFEMDFYNNEIKNDASNTKFDSYLDELVELIVRDYVMDWLGDLIWEKEKFALLIK